MPSEAAEAIWTRREDRPQGGFGHRFHRVSRAPVKDPEELARSFLRRHAQAVVLVAGESVGGKTSSFADLDWFLSVRQQEEFDVIAAAWAISEGFRPEGARTHTFRPEFSPSDRDLQLYKDELKKVRSERNDEDRQARERKKAASAYLDEAIALAHPISLRLLAWLHVSGNLNLERVFEVFGASASTFEGVARLHLIGALKFDNGDLRITSLGSRVLEEFGLLASKEAEDSESHISS